MKLEIFVPHSDVEQKNRDALVEYLNEIYYG